ncbi:MAG: hypothetical protein ACQCN6_01520 [Candidatus Bathyarchaeia archaeon]|jgi:hypothetical protein
MNTQKNDENYFACKKAFQEWDGKNGTDLKQKLKEIFTPQVQAEMNQQARIYEAQRPTEEALAHAQTVAWKTGEVNPSLIR